MRTYAFLLTLACSSACAQDPLSSSVKLISPPEGRSLHISYRSTSSRLYHTLHPWHQTVYHVSGTACLDGRMLVLADTLTRIGGNKAFPREVVLNDRQLSVKEAGSQTTAPVSWDDHTEELIGTAMFTPAYILNWLQRQKTHSSNNKSGTLYSSSINGTHITAQLNTKDRTVSRITVTRHDGQHGDVRTDYSYHAYKRSENVLYPALVRVESYGGRVRDSTVISRAEVTAACPHLKAPVTFPSFDETPGTAPVIRSTSVSPGVWLLDLVHVSEQVMMVEFRDFVFVMEAPLNSGNGELIIREAARLAPGKPVRYFSFGHYHPHYTGGIRPFIHKQATILCTGSDVEFVKYLATASHSMKPDSLHLQPRPVKIDTVRRMRSVSDGDMEVQVWFIGERSAHTNDYLVYYLPKQKLLFEGDLAWILKAKPADGKRIEPGKSQVGLYNAIKELNLDADTIIQSWQTGQDRYLTRFTLAQLAESVGG